MKLSRFIQLLEKSDVTARVRLPLGVDADSVELNSVVCDSRKAEKGAVFAATKGERQDGHDFIAQAVKAGASAALCEHEVDIDVPQIICGNARAAMGEAAAIIFDRPADKMTMIAITGTNGKTTSAFMTKAVLERAEIKTGLMGTVLYDDGATTREAEHTTPEGCDIQAILARMARNGCKACVMEASSHAIVQGRINGVMYDRACFTNLTLDHLDYHKTMENYFLAKKTLFDKFMRNNWKAAANIDDEYGRRIYASLGKRGVSYSITNDEADFFASIENVAIDGLDLEIKTPFSRGKERIKLPLLGAYNVLNALGSLSVATSLGVSSKSALSALSSMPQVPGRLERYRFDNGASCVIDFAHSSDGLEKVLGAVKPICKGNLIVVFGAGGDRDRTKRPVMGEAASRLGDYVVVTSDNPRTEDPDFIISEIIPGVERHKTPYTKITDRREAIYAALDAAKSGDVVVVAGRGPETHQITKDGPVPLVDKEIMEDWLKLRGWRTVK